MRSVAGCSAPQCGWLVESAVALMVLPPLRCAAAVAPTPPPPQVFASIPACVDLLEGPYIETHDAVVKAFRPAALVRTQKPAAR